jgi:hypothetical protein
VHERASMLSYTYIACLIVTIKCHDIAHKITGSLTLFPSKLNVDTLCIQIYFNHYNSRNDVRMQVCAKRKLVSTEKSHPGVNAGNSHLSFLAHVEGSNQISQFSMQPMNCRR